MPRKRRKMYLLCAIVFFAVLLLIADQIWIRVWLIVPIGYNTTRLTHPVMPGPAGRTDVVNYVSALNLRAGRGVATSDNAAPLLIEAAGPRHFPIAIKTVPLIMAKLNIPPFTPRSPSLVTFSQWIAHHPQSGGLSTDRQAGALEERLQKRPWTASRYPVAYGWIHANSRALALLSRAARRPRYYMPLVSTDGLVIGCYQPVLLLGSLRDLACAKAMLLLGSGNIPAALRESRTVFRLGQLLAQPGRVTYYLIMLTLENSAMVADQAIANSRLVSAGQLRALAQSLRNLPPLPPLIHALNGARFVALNELMQANAVGPAAYFYGNQATVLARAQAMFLPINYAGLMYHTNRLFDAEIAASREHPFLAMKASLAKADAQFAAFSGNERERLTGTIANPQFNSAGGSPATLVFNNLFRPFAVVVSQENPHGADLAVIREMSVMIRKLTCLSVALARYRKQRHVYPLRLSDLSPDYFNKIPNDPFTGGPLYYATTSDQKGFELYCDRRNRQVGHSGPGAGKMYHITVHGGDWGAPAMPSTAPASSK